jgi:proteasome lid subunit RPN8/RPN11
VCGALVRDTGELLLLDNVHPEPEHSFRLSTKDAYLVAAECEVFLHSHAPEFEWPSETDMQLCLQSSLPWCVVPRQREAFWFGPGVPTPPLEMRGFRFGVTDCYSLIRDWYAENRPDPIGDYARRWAFWKDDEDLYGDLFPDEGFREVTCKPSNLELGDVLLMSIRCKVTNHAAVYVDNGAMLHHPSGRGPVDSTQLSRTDPVMRYWQHVRKVVRRE